MAKRALTLLGRMGMVLLVSGLAVGLASLIPPYSQSPSMMESSTIGAHKYTSIVPFLPNILDSSQLYSPRRGLSISAHSNGSMYLCLLDVKQDQLDNWSMTWVREHYPSLSLYEAWLGTRNLTVLYSVLQLHSVAVLWNSSLTSSVSVGFYPPTVMNVSNVVANPSDHAIMVNMTRRDLTSFAPQDRVRLASEFLIPLGMVLAAPWALRRVRKKAPVE